MINLEKKHWIIIGVTIFVIAVFIFWPESEKDKLYNTVQKGDFRIEVNSSGELKAKESEDIKGPTSLRSHGIWQIKITDLVSEGTYVKQGDYVAQLDKSEVATKMSATATEVEKITTEYEQARLDTAIEMMKLRDELINLNYEIEEKKLISDQSTYEAPAVQRQAEIDLEKAERKLKQSIGNISLKRKQNAAKLHQVKLSLKQEQSKLDRLEELIQELKILAPKDG
ncbi:MAG: RND transporter, partial [Flavobacteriales bacterium]|nr:RND transporter [Flavobacteriales bacterium]